MVKKALSAEAKKDKLLEIYHTTKDVLNLKELEKLGAKAGVVQNTIKDLNQQLVNDGLVDGDKIGASNFFWSFPSKALLQHVNRIASLKEQIAETEASLQEAKRKGAELRGLRVDCEARRTKLRRLGEEQERQASLKEGAAELKENDPQELERVQEQAEAAKAGVNIWTDNIWAIKAYMVKKQGMSGKEVDRMMNLKEDFDYV